MATERENVEIVIEHLTKGLDRVQASIDKQKELGGNTKDLQQEFDALARTIDELTLQQQLIEQLTEANARLEQAQTEVDEFGERLAEATKEVNQLSKAQADANSALDDASQRLNDADIRSKQFAVGTAELKRELAANKTALSDAGKALRVMQQAYEAAEAPTEAQTVELQAQQQAVELLTQRDRELADQIKQLAVEEKQAKVTREVLKQETKELDAAVKGAAAETKAAERNVERLTASHEKASDRVDNYTTDVDELRKVLRDAGIDTDKLGDEQVRLASALVEARGKVSSLGGSVDDVTRKLVEKRNITESARTRIAALGTAIGNLASDAIRRGISAIRDLGARILELGGSTENYRIRLTALEGSQEKANAAMQRLIKISRDTGTQLDANLDTYAKLKNFGLDPLDGALQAIIDQTAKLGGEQQTQERIVLALGQAYAKQKLQGEEILQLVEAGVPVYDLLSKAIGRSAAEISDLAQRGELGRDSIEKLIQAIGDAAEGSAADQLNSFRGLITQIQQRFTEFLRVIGSGPLFDALKGQLQRVRDLFDNNRAAVDQLANRISQFLADAVNAFARFTEFVIRNAEAIAQLTKVVSIFIGLKFAATLLGWGKALLSFAGDAKKAAGSLGDITTAAGKVPRKIPINLLLLGAAAVYAGFAKLREIAKDTFTFLRTEEEKLTAKFKAEADEQSRFVEEQYAARIQALNDYSDVSDITAERVAQASERERVALQATIEKAILRTELQIGQAKLIGQSTFELNEKLDSQRAQLELVAGAQSKLGAQSGELADELDSVGDKADTAATALGKLGGDDVRKAIDASAAELAEVSAEVVRLEGLVASFGREAEGGFGLFGELLDEANAKQEELRGGLDNLRSDLAERFGVDVSEALTGLSEKFNEISGAFDIMAASAGAADPLVGALSIKLAEQATTGEEVKQALEQIAGAHDKGVNPAKTHQAATTELTAKLVELADTGAAIEEAERVIRQAWKDGGLVLKDYEAQLEALRKKREELNEQSNIWARGLSDLRLAEEDLAKQLRDGTITQAEYLSAREANILATVDAAAAAGDLHKAEALLEAGLARGAVTAAGFESKLAELEKAHDEAAEGAEEQGDELDELGDTMDDLGGKAGNLGRELGAAAEASIASWRNLDGTIRQVAETAREAAQEIRTVAGQSLGGYGDLDSDQRAQVDTVLNREIRAVSVIDQINQINARQRDAQALIDSFGDNTLTGSVRSNTAGGALQGRLGGGASGSDEEPDPATVVPDRPVRTQADRQAALDRLLAALENAARFGFSESSGTADETVHHPPGSLLPVGLPATATAAERQRFVDAMERFVTGLEDTSSAGPTLTVVLASADGLNVPLTTAERNRTDLLNIIERGRRTSVFD